MAKLASRVMLSPGVSVSLLRLTLGAAAVLSSVKFSDVVLEVFPATSVCLTKRLTAPSWKSGALAVQDRPPSML